MVLSGMSSMEQMQDNLSYMKDFAPLNDAELAAVNRVQEIFHKKDLIPCTSCRYCTDGCPKHISIPDLFAIMNTKHTHHDWNADYYYEDVHTGPGSPRLGLHPLRPVRARLPPAPAHQTAAAGCGEGV